MAFTLQIGDSAPHFQLPATDGNSYSLDDFEDTRVLVIFFTCNHCPVAQAYERRLSDLAKSYKEKGVAVVAISSNDPEAVPQDSFENMLRQAKGKKYPHPYIFDPDQTAAKAYGATCTPHVFVLCKDRKIAYMGAVDDNNNPNNVKETSLRDALDALLDGKEPPKDVTQQRGCSIKWKK